jgi:beta-N-acetylhexosaminidase
MITGQTLKISMQRNLLSVKKLIFIPSGISIFAAERYSHNRSRMTKRFSTAFALSLIIVSNVFAQSPKNQWVDSVFRTLNTDQKIRQMFLSTVSSHWEKPELNMVEKELTLGLGGLFFTSGHPVKQLDITSKYQREAKVPLLIAADVANGLSSILDSTLFYPTPIAQSAFKNDSLIYLQAKLIGSELRTLGVNLNLGVNANYADLKGSYGWRNQYGNNRQTITRNALAFMKGLQSEGILAGAKYFPIQGVTITDIKKEVMSVQAFADTTHTSPFQFLFSNGADAVVMASNDLPVFMENKKLARKNKLPGSVLSAAYGNSWVRNKMKFQGLVICDLRFAATKEKKIKTGEAELAAFLGGNDLIITAQNVSPAARRIKRFLKKHSDYNAQLDNAVRKILSAKYDAHLQVKPMLNNQNLLSRLNNPESKKFQRTLLTSSITVVKNTNNLLPVISLENKKFATVFLGDTINGGPFQQIVSKYVNAKHIIVKNENELSSFKTTFKQHDVIIIAVTEATPSVLLDSVTQHLSSDTTKEIILADFGSAHVYAYEKYFPVIITAYSYHRELARLIPQTIFGATSSTGKFPMTVSTIREGTSAQTASLKRLEYSFPEDAGMASESLRQIESIAKEAIDMGGTPGCYVLIAKDGKVIYQKAFGHLTYEKQTPVTDSTIYDLASVTKVSATLQSAMFLYDRGLLDINKKASTYLPELKKSNKENYTLKDILTHQAGLWPFLPFWAQTMKDNEYLPQYYSNELSFKYPYLVADKLYAHVSMRDSLWSWIIKAKVREKPARTPYDYKYSDMGFYIMQHVAEKILNQPMEDFLEQNLYEPLGAYTTGYLPLLRFKPNRIAPTENDKLFRKTLLVGTVHDQGAAMLGGVAGHAGLFSTANDLAKLCQMLLQEGYYGGYRYYRPETVRLFTKKQFETSKRGLGWDRPVLSDNNGVTSVYASQKTFGHTGFTGTCIWMDPEFNVVYIFLSNRVHPDMTNNKLLNANIRSRIQDVVYQSIFDYCKGSTGQPLENPALPIYPSASNNN